MNTDVDKADAVTRVFTYGTLMRGHGNNRILRHSKFIGKGVLYRYRLYTLVTAYPGIKPHHDKPRECVIGEVYEVNDETLKRLDVLEGIHWGLYRKETVTIYLESGLKTSAYVYVYNKKKYLNPPEWLHLPDGDWSKYVKERIEAQLEAQQREFDEYVNKQKEEKDVTESLQNQNTQVSQGTVV